MSKKSRKKASAHRASMKKARKEQMQTQYQKWAEEGNNKKSKRQTLSNRRKRNIKIISHPHGKCGNVGCKRCNDVDRPSRSKVVKPYTTSKEYLTFKNTHQRILKTSEQILAQLQKLNEQFGEEHGATKERAKLAA